jgi:hypothetical protein
VPLFITGRKTGKTKEVRVPVAKLLNYNELTEEAKELVSVGADLVVFRAYSIDEKIPRYQRQTKEQPMERLVHPGWYDEIWSTAKIGKVYEDFFGIGSISDPQIVTDPFSQLGRVGSESAESASEDKETSGSEDDPSRDAPAVVGLEEGASIQAAVDFLLLTYSYIKQNGLDVDEFIRGYTWRPIASMVDMFGTTDLEFSSDGERVLNGKEGFHSRAFGPYDNLFGLVTPEVEDILGIKRGDVTAQKGDVRKARREMVLKYISALQFSRGILG